MQWVQFEINNRVATVIMTRIDKRNALNPQLVRELTAAFSELNEREDVKIITLKSAAPAFSAGADLAYIQELRNFTYDENVQDTLNLKTLFEAIYQSPKITLSQVEGPALAGGCGLATVTDFCFASKDSTFGYTESRIGFVPALVMVYLRHKLTLQKQTEWLLTGGIFSADKACEDGLIYKVCDNVAADIDMFTSQLLTGVSMQSITRTKSMLRNLPYSHEEALLFAAHNNAEARQSQDCINGIDSFLRKEKKTW